MALRFRQGWFQLESSTLFLIDFRNFKEKDVAVTDVDDNDNNVEVDKTDTCFDDVNCSSDDYDDEDVVGV